MLSSELKAATRPAANFQLPNLRQPILTAWSHAGAPCDRFAARPSDGLWPPCKPNLMRFCHMDLAAVVYDWGRFRRENRSFLAMDFYPVVGIRLTYDTAHQMRLGW